MVMLHCQLLPSADLSCAATSAAAYHDGWVDADCCTVPAVVVVLSKEFISKPYPMKELQQLLLHWRDRGHKALLLPVCYNISREEALQAFDPAHKEEVGASLVGNKVSIFLAVY
jgi:hypothetical protein